MHLITNLISVFSLYCT